MNDSIYCIETWNGVTYAIPCRRDDADSSVPSARPLLIASDPESAMCFIDYVFKRNAELTYREWNREFREAGFDVPETIFG